MSGLRRYARRDVVGDDPGNSIHHERIGMLLSLEITIAAVNIDGAIPGVLLDYGKIGRHKRVATPIEQARGQSMVLGDRKPLPVINGRSVQVRDGTLLEKS